MADNKYIYTAQDFKSDQEVKWCPGCGDYAILTSVVKAMPEVAKRDGIPHEKFVVVSGIGCSSRFPYYVNIYGFHSIHGRAAAIATGLKVANPDLSVWVTSGDGDSLAIGGNHFIHAIRRNIDLNLIIFNNQIYGLTKGQYSPTSEFGKITKTSPFGTVEYPFKPGELVLGARGKFFARSLDVEVGLTQQLCEAGAEHKGMSVIEVLQNCVIFNDKTFAKFTATKELREEKTIVLKHGERMLFGKEKNKGLRLNGLKLEVVTIGENGVTEEDVLIHDAHEPNPSIHMMLADMEGPDFPVALGIIRDVKDDSYDNRVCQQVADVQSNCQIHNVDELLNSGNVWEVK